MTHIDCCTPSLRVPRPPPGGRVHQLIRQLAPVLAPALVLAALGCREDAESPTAPEPKPALDIAPAQALAFRQVSAGSDYTCGVTTDDRAYCWGSNFFGQLGDGTSENTRLTPVPVAGGLLFRRVDAGSEHTCGVTIENLAYCWGFGGGGLGNGTLPGSPMPVAVAGGRRFRQVSAGSDYTCGVTTGDRAFCWGRNHFGQLGDGSQTTRLTPVRVAGGLAFHQVSTAFVHTCAVTPSNVAYCWGAPTGARQLQLTPVAVAGGPRFRQVSAAERHTCGLTPADLAFCWGQNSEGQLGDNTRTDRPAPVHVHAHGRLFRQVSAGFQFTCGVTLDNLAYCWGRNFEGQIGSGTTLFRHRLPTAVAGGLHFRQVTAGTNHTCGVTTDNRAYCWGENLEGGLGDGTTTNHRTPIAVAPPAP
jgi:alpha-tubulin suppressor-like RCC1 family protein